MKPYINPMNPYTGHVSVRAIMENLKNGYTTFPEHMGSTKPEGWVSGDDSTLPDERPEDDEDDD